MHDKDKSLKNALCLGLGKTLFNSSAALIYKENNRLEIELILTERLLRQKASGAWPEKAIIELAKTHNLENCGIAENRDVVSPQAIEKALNSALPFFEYLKKKNLFRFSSHFNSDVKFITHHRCHASAALMMSPFEKALILVIDGAGSNAKDFIEDNEEKKLIPKDYANDDYLEEASVFSIDGGKLFCLEKNWQLFKKSQKAEGHWFSEGLGTLYEKSAEYIFNDKRAAGKVMGLAAFGRPQEIVRRSLFLESLDWSLSFSGRGKSEWESSKHFNKYADVAASVQNHFEKSLMKIANDLHQKYPDYENLILMGGCALNCTTNMLLHRSGLFKSIYVAPFPGDESIGLGAASYLYHAVQKNAWTPRPWEIQGGYFGLTASIPTNDEIEKEFSSFSITKPESIEKYTAKKISENKTIGWFQGRSETGPRALGNRSILARVDRAGLKSHLNEVVKKRESFRPYGCSVLHESAPEYFDVPNGFENPFMSFAVKTRPEYAEALKEVTHFDGTSRMQTVRQTQNPRFYKLIKEVGSLTGVACVLNTSLNVMGEPIVETIQDAKRFLLTAQVDAIVIGDYYIEKETTGAN